MCYCLPVWSMKRIAKRLSLGLLGLDNATDKGWGDGSSDRDKATSVLLSSITFPKAGLMEPINTYSPGDVGSLSRIRIGKYQGGCSLLQHEDNSWAQGRNVV